jgi:hypothetical protein
MSPDEILARLSDYKRLPIDAINAARAARSAVTPMFLGRLERFLALPEHERDDDPALFLIPFLLAEWREKAAYRPLARLFRLGDDDLDKLLGDVVTEYAHKIMVEVYDGDPAPIYEVILDENANQWARGRMFDALVLLVIRGELDRDTASEFVRRAYDALRPRDENMVWEGWQGAVARLRLAELSPKVKAAIEDDFWVPAGFMEYEDFEGDLRYAIEHPDAPWTDAAEMSPIGAVEVELADWPFNARRDEPDDDFVDDDLDRFDRSLFGHDPVTNPLRFVGRNDPCPCGSGKKYKKCCLGRELPLGNG